MTSEVRNTHPYANLRVSIPEENYPPIPTVPMGEGNVSISRPKKRSRENSDSMIQLTKKVQKHEQTIKNTVPQFIDYDREEFDLGGDPSLKKIPPNLSKMLPNLKSLDLSDSRISLTQEDRNILCNLSQLEKINLVRNRNISENNLYRLLVRLAWVKKSITIIADRPILDFALDSWKAKLRKHMILDGQCAGETVFLQLKKTQD